MPQLRSLRAKLLALILTPVVVALALTTFIAISRASSAQKASAYSELTQQTRVEAAKVDATVNDALDAAHAAATVLATADSRPSAAAGLKAVLADHRDNLAAVFSGLTANGFDGKDATSKGAIGT